MRLGEPLGTDFFFETVEVLPQVLTGDLEKFLVENIFGLCLPQGFFELFDLLFQLPYERRDLYAILR